MVSPLQAQEGVSETLQVSDAVVATAVEHLVPQGSGETFPSTVGALYAFSRILGAEGETVVVHKWFHGEELRAKIPLPIRSKNWRTYSSKNILPEWTGDWRVDVTTEDGTVLTSLSFTVQ